MCPSKPFQTSNHERRNLFSNKYQTNDIEIGLKLKPIPTDGWMFPVRKSVSVGVSEVFTVLIEVTIKKGSISFASEKVWI